VLLDALADLGHQRGHETAAFLEVAALGSNTALSSSTRKVQSPPLRNTAETTRVSASTHWKWSMCLRVDEDLVGAALLVRGARVQHDVVDRDVQRVLRERRLELVGGARERLGRETFSFMLSIAALELLGYRRLLGQRFEDLVSTMRLAILTVMFAGTPQNLP